MGLAVVAFVTWGSYTRRVTLSGQLMPSTGLVRVQVPQPGVVLRMRVQEGQTVAQGQALFDLGSDRQALAADRAVPAPPGTAAAFTATASAHPSSAGAAASSGTGVARTVPGGAAEIGGSGGSGESGASGVQAAVSTRVRQRGDSVAAQTAQTRVLQAEESSALARRLVLLKAQGDALDAQAASQRQRAGIAEETEARAASLVAQGFYAKEQAQLRRAESLDQQVRLQGLLRERESIAQEIQARSDDLRALPLRHRAVLAELDRHRLGLEQELAESESRRELVITAPQAGMVTAVVVEAGQTVAPARVLLSIVPSGAQLQAHFYAPSRAMGFVRVGDPVRLRYQAYPYQKFGQAKGVVQAIARTALPAADLAAAGLLQGAATGEPLYRITATLASQTIDAAGRAWPLQVSMAVEADVMQDNRRLYEWVLEPLYGLAGRL
jgi:membrane fusion protein